VSPCLEEYPGIEGAHGGAGDAQKLEHAFHIFLAAQHRPAQHAPLSVQIFGGGVDHNIRTKFQRTLQDRGTETIVHYQQRAAALGHC